jgi:hypothetical protein
MMDSVVGASSPERKKILPKMFSKKHLQGADDPYEFSHFFDYVMVFKMLGKQYDTQSKLAKYCIHQMMKVGLEIYPYLSIQNDELILLIRASVSEIP